MDNRKYIEQFENQDVWNHFKLIDEEKCGKSLYLAKSFGVDPQDVPGKNTQQPTTKNSALPSSGLRYQIPQPDQYTIY